MNKKTKIMAILVVLFITIISSIFVLKFNNRVKCSLACDEKNNNCIYTVSSSKVKPFEFEYDEILQCTISQIVRASKDPNAHGNIYEMKILLNTKNADIILRHHSHKLLSDTCYNALEKKSFAIKGHKNRK